MSSSETKNTQIWRRESQRLTAASKALSRLMRKTIHGRRVEAGKDDGGAGFDQTPSTSMPSSGLRVERCGGNEYFQVEISSNHRHSGGSDKYSVVADTKQDITEHDNNDGNNNITTSEHYAIIDVTHPEPKWVNYSGPDIIQDLPQTPQVNNKHKIVRSSSFLNPGTIPPLQTQTPGAGLRRGRGVQRSASSVSSMAPRPVCGVRAVNNRQQQHLRQQQQQQQQQKRGSGVQRSFSNVSSMTLPPSRPGHIVRRRMSPQHHVMTQHIRQGSVSSTSTSSGSLGSSGFVSPNKVRVRPYISSPAVPKPSSFSPPSRYSSSDHSPAAARYSSDQTSSFIQFPSSNSAFRRPKPITDKRKELEMYASQWQDWGNRRASRDAIVKPVPQTETSSKSWHSTKSLTLPRKLSSTKALAESVADKCESGGEKYFHSLPRHKHMSKQRANAPAKVKSLVSLFEKKVDISTEDDDNDVDNSPSCDNSVIISPPLQFVDTSSAASNVVRSKTRTDFVGDILNLVSESNDDDNLTKITQHLYTTLLSKLVCYREKLNTLSSDYEKLTLDLRELDNKLINRAPYHVVDKYRVHLADTDKIVRLILSVTGRLVSINTDLDKMSWSGLEERRMMESKRDKLLDQLEDTKELWQNIERRSHAVLSHVEHYAGDSEGELLEDMLRRKVRLMVEKKELEEKIETGERQLGAMKVIETFEVIV